MNDDIQAELRREIELLLKQTGLFRFVRAVVDIGFDFFFRETLERLGKNLRLAFLRYLNAREPMIIQTGFANRHDARTFCQFAQRRNHVLAGFLDVSWVNADDGEDVWIFLRQIDRAPAAFHRSADRDDARDAGLGGAAQDVIEVAGEIRVVEMRVSLDEHFR